jgi:hypothetical protein
MFVRSEKWLKIGDPRTVSYLEDGKTRRVRTRVEGVAAIERLTSSRQKALFVIRYVSREGDFHEFWLKMYVQSVLLLYFTAFF